MISFEVGSVARASPSDSTIERTHFNSVIFNCVGGKIVGISPVFGVDGNCQVFIACHIITIDTIADEHGNS